MADVVPINTKERLENLEQQLKSAGGGGTFDGMEVRVAKLEAHMEHIVRQVDRLATVPTELAIVKATMATKGWLVTGLLLSLGAIAALIAFAEKIQTLVD